jgi:hypothetical protein
MEIYLITLLFLIIFSFSEIFFNKKSDIYLKYGGFFVFLILILQTGLRWETGTDWLPYKSHFDETESINSIGISLLLGFEPGYTLFILFSKLISSNYSFFLIIHSILYFGLIFVFLKSTKSSFFLVLFLFYVVSIGYLGSNRQLLAMSIGAFSFKYIEEKKFILFLLTVLLAISFHISALIYFLFYAFNKRINNTIIISCLCLSILIGYSFIPEYLFMKFSSIFGVLGTIKSEFYLTETQNSIDNFKLSTIGLLKRLFLFIILIFNYKKLDNTYIYFKLFFNTYFIGLIIYFLFNNSVIILISRGSLYFSVIECILIVYLFKLVTNRKEKLFLYILIITYGIFTFNQSISSFYNLFVPYKGVNYNEKIIKEIY